MSRRRHRKYDDKTLEFVVYIMLAIFLMPIVGIVLLGKKSIPLKILGVVLLVLGIIIWVKLAAG